jgi:hypothetical protein
MNLETLVERACLEAGYNDADDVTAAEKFARHWDEHIWNSALWKAALVACDVAVTPASNDDHAEGVVYLPEVIDRVVAVRSTSNQIVVRGQEHYYRMDWDAFGATGTPLEFVILPPAWFSWRTSDPSGYLEISGAEADAASKIKVVWVDGNGKRSATETTVGGTATIGPALGGLITVLAAYKEATTGEVNLTTVALGENLVPGNAVYDAHDGYELTGLTPGASYYFTKVDAGSYINIIDGPPVLLNDSGYFTAPDNGIIAIQGGGSSGVVSSTIKPVTTTTVGTLAAADTANPTYPRLRLIPKPTADLTATVLGKAKYEPLEFDQQEPALRNCTNALLAFMRGSLKRRGGEIGAAQLEFAEANALVKQVEQIEALQAANNQRFIPEEGYGPTGGLGPMGSYFS